MDKVYLIGCSITVIIVPFVTEASYIETAALQLAYLLTGYAGWRTFS